MEVADLPEAQALRQQKPGPGIQTGRLAKGINCEKHQSSLHLTDILTKPNINEMTMNITHETNPMSTSKVLTSQTNCVVVAPSGVTMKNLNVDEPEAQVPDVPEAQVPDVPEAQVPEVQALCEPKKPALGHETRVRNASNLNVMNYCSEDFTPEDFTPEDCCPEHYCSEHSEAYCSEPDPTVTNCPVHYWSEHSSEAYRSEHDPTVTNFCTCNPNVKKPLHLNATKPESVDTNSQPIGTNGKDKVTDRYTCKGNGDIVTTIKDRASGKGSDLEIETLNEGSGGNDITVDVSESSVVAASMHQGNEIFPDFSRGRFCLCAAVVAIETLQNLENPSTADVDDVLIEGASLYEKVTNKLIEQHAYLPDAYLSFRDLPRDMETSSNQFMCDVNEGDLLLGKCISTDDENMSITQAVKQTFDRHNAGLIIIGNLAICIFLNANGQFCLFDSHSRTLQGEQTANGTAILMCFASLEDLQEQIVRLVCSIASDPVSVCYELQPVQISRTRDDTLDRSERVFPSVDEDWVMFDEVACGNTCNVECANMFSVLSEECGIEGNDQEYMEQSLEQDSTEMLVNSTEVQHTDQTEVHRRSDSVAHIVQGNISQADSCFAQFNNTKLSLSNALMSLTCLEKQAEFQPSNVNYALLEGARLCDKSQSKISPSNVEKTIPTLLSGTGGIHDVDRMESFEGSLRNGMSTRSQKGRNLVDGLGKAFTCSNTLIISLGNYFLSAFKSSSGSYVVFNPNPCSIQGLPMQSGKATLAVCNSIEQASEVIEDVAKNTKNKVARYKIVSLTIVEKASTSTHQCPVVNESTQHNNNTECDRTKFEKREYMKQYMRKRRQQSHIRESEREYITKRRLDSELVAKERQARVHRYKCNETSRSQEVKRSIGKYATCKTFRDKIKKYSSTKYRQIPEFRDKVKSYSSTKYRQIPEFREKAKRYSSTKYQQNLQFRVQVKQYSSAKHRRCPLFRVKMNLAKKVKYYNISAFRDNKKQTARLNYMKIRADPHLRKRSKEMMRRQYLKNMEARRLKALQRKKQIQEHRKDIESLKKDFESAVQEYPEYVCSVCHRLLFRKQVLKCNKAKYETSSSKTRLARTCINDNMEHKSNDSSVQRKSRVDMYICHTCDRHLSSGKMPPEACANRLQLQPIPHELQSLNILEKHLISRMVPFMKVITLPKGGQKKLKGPCVLVPSNLQDTLNVLPRCDADTPQIIKLKMKRKLSYKGYYEYCHVNMQKVHEALRCLKYELENLHYRDVDIDNSNHLTSEEREGSDVDNPDSGDIDDQVDPQKQQSSESVNIESVVDEDDENVEDEAVRGGPVLDTFLMPVDMVQESLPFCPDSILSIAPCEGNKPTNIFADKTCEALAFPNHFPDGQNTLTEQRQLQLSPSKYFQARLMNVDPRFARDTQYIFYGLYITEVKFISSNISIALRKGKKRTKDGKRITAGTLSQRKGIDHVTGEDTGFRHFPTLKGSPDYWRQTQHDLFAMIRQLGIPTFFCTFSCNNDWPEIVTAVKAQQGETVDVTTLSWEEKCNILASNQVTCARMFDHRVKLFLNTVIRSPAAPIGNVIDWFYRVEWQARGSPHIHCLFWVKDAPILGRDTDLAVCDFVDQFISCKVPPENVALHNKVTRFQQHSKHHTKSCKKGNSPCRFNYPRPVAKRTFVSRPVSKTDEHAPSNAEMEYARNQLSSVRDMLNGDLENDNISVDELLEKAEMTWATYRNLFDIVTKRVTVVMKRDSKDCWINNYNPALLDIWNANMDIQYITDPYSCVMYILSYISKAEHELSDILRHAQDELRQGNVDLKSQMKKLGNVYLDYREVSCQEAAHRMCNLHLKECSRAVVNLPVDENATRMSLPLAQIEAKAKADENDDDIWFKSLVDRYQARPDGEEFDNMCLAKFASEFRIVYGQTKSPNSFTLKDNFGTIQRRQTNSFAVIRYARHSKTTKPEQFYQSQLKVYLPWRHNCQLKPVGYTTYEEFYDNGAVRLSEAQEIKPVKMIVSENKVTYEKDADVLQDAWEMLQSCENLEDAWASVANQAEISRLEAEEENAAFDRNDEPLTDDHDYLDQEPRDQIPARLAIDHSDDGCITRVVRPLLKCMNKRQQQVFYNVRKWCLDKVNGLNPEPFKIFLSGAAGVGKSLLIKCIHYEATKILLQHQSNQNLQPVFLTATTGLAAFNVDGFTIHSLLKIIKPRQGSYIPLSENILNTMNTKLGEMKILVVDEVSMMGSQILEYVHKRLGQLKHNKELFGGICILAVGDFYQLPPVRAGSPICVPKKCDLWMENFKCVELTEIMRQRDDAVFAALLNRLRVKERNESLTACDTEKLLGRLTSHENCPHDALFIYAKNKEVDHHNEEMLLNKCRDISEIVAVDVVRNRTTGRLEERPALKANQKSESLPGRLRIAVGARVMVTKNVDTEHGITNGALGTVTAILPADQDKPLPKGVCIQFDNEKVGRGLTESNPNSTIPLGSVKLMPYEEAMDPVEQERKGGIRRQFPLKLAWACTIHKVQGLTVDKIVISMKSMFESGHAYVAFSRVTNMEGLYLLDFNANKIYRNEGVAQGLVKMEPLQLPNPLDGSHDGITIVHHNVEGLLQNFENQANHFQMFTSDVVLLTETWLSSEEDPSKFQHKDFHMYCKSRRESYDIQSMASLAKGGVAVYVKKGVPHGFADFSVPNIEFISILVCTAEKPVMISVVYRPARYTTSLFCHALQELLVKMEEASSGTLSGYIVTGDFNEDLMKGQKTISNLMSRNDYQQIITQATTLGNTLLDVIYVKDVNVRNSGIFQTYYSYHDAVYLQI